jgi:hypothetical protein
VPVHQKRTGHDIAAERSLRQARDHSHEVVGPVQVYF